MGEIYCLYSTASGMPRYVGRSDQSAERRYKQHITRALDMVDGDLCEWIRAVWKDKHEVGYHVLQSDVIPADMALFEQYWISQFPGLLNQHYNMDSTAELSEIGRRVVLAIKAKLVSAN